MAQVFASHRYNKNFTIYQVEIPANRCVFDLHDVGNCGSSGEIFVLGGIFPEEIVAVKIDNSDSASELLFTDESGTNLIKDRPQHDSVNRSVKNIHNWKRVR